VLAVPLLSTIFQYNAFSTNDVEMSALALQAFSVGVCGFIFVKVLAPGFFARQDTQTPMRIAVVAVAVNVVLSVVLVRSLQHTGLALAISIAAWVNASLLFITLRARKIYTPLSGWLWFLGRVAIAVAVMTGALLFLNVENQVWFAWGLGERILRLCMLVTTGGLAYLVCLFVLGLRPQQLLLHRPLTD